MNDHPHRVRVAPYSEGLHLELTSNHRTLGLSREMAQDLFTALSAVLFSGASQWPETESTPTEPRPVAPKLKSTGDLLSLLKRSLPNDQV